MYHSDGPCDGGDMIIGMTIPEEHVIGFKVVKALDASWQTWCREAKCNVGRQW
jgi:hypothetical protein